MKKLLFLIMAVLLCSCARPAHQPEKQPLAMHAWEKMLRFSSEQHQPYRLQLSMRFGEEGNTRRVTGLLWGNGEDSFRLDVMAGVGATVAMISENGDSFLVYAPRENKAYFHDGPSRPLLKVGVPVPIELSHLAGILTGRFADVFGAAPRNCVAQANGNAICELAGPLPGELTLDGEGVPVRWRQQDGGWTLELAYAEDVQFLPKSLKLRNANGKMAVILVKKRESLQVPFTDKQLKLAFPPGTPLLPLSRFKSN